MTLEIHELTVDAETWATLEPDPVLSNPPRRKKAASSRRKSTRDENAAYERLQRTAYDTYEGLQVKLALVRPPDYDPRKAVVVVSAEDAAKLVARLELEPVEMFLVILLDGNDFVIGIYEVGRGSMHSVNFTPRNVFAPALLTNADQIILVHNHPLGDPSPSPQDIELTRGLHLLGSNFLNVIVQDHLIIGHKRYHSIAENEGMFGATSLPLRPTRTRKKSRVVVKKRRRRGK